MRKLAFAASAALFVLSTTALAAVTFNSADGTGAVPKGDLQSAFGWNDAAYQANAGSVVFSTGGSGTYWIKCEWDMAVGRTTIHRVSGYRVTSSSYREINRSLSTNSSGKITGITLTGYAGPATGGSGLPEIGDNCPATRSDAQVTAVTLMSGGSGGSGLKATFGGTTKTLVP